VTEELASANSEIPTYSHSLPKSVAFIVVANTSMAVYQWIVVIAAARLIAVQDLGLLTLSYALSAPLLTVMTVGLRLVQIRDVQFRATAAQYLRVRIALVTLAAFASAGFAEFFVSDWHQRYIVYSVIVVKSIEAIADSYWSFLLGVSASLDLAWVLLIRSTASAAAFVGVLVLTDSVAVAMGALGVVALILLFFVDARVARRVSGNLPKHADGARDAPWRWMARAALPLGVASAVISLGFNIPRYFLAHYAGPGEVGVFSAMAYVFVAASLLTAAVGQTAIPRMSGALASRSAAGVRRMLSVMFAIAAVIGAVAMGIGLPFGADILRLIYGKPYGSEVVAFRWLLGALVLGCFVTFIQDALTVLDWLGTQVVGFTLGAATTALLCEIWVPDHGASAAAAALFFGLAAEGVFFTVALLRALRQHSPNLVQSAALSQ
jgi:O-antigen/teichoic acid export membrane protein